MNNIGNPGDTIHYFFLAVMALAVVFMLRDQLRVYAHLKDYGQLERLPLEISPDTFRARFHERIGTGKDYFRGEMFTKTEFYIQYVGKHTPKHGGWISLRGIIYENEIKFDVSGKPIYQGEKVERERLVNKLKELCAPEAE